MCSVKEDAGRRWTTNFGPREWLAIAAIFAGVVGQWYTTRTDMKYAIQRLDRLEERMQKRDDDQWTGADHARYADHVQSRFARIEDRLSELEDAR